MAKSLTIGLSLSLSGEYAAIGRQIESALRLFVADLNSSGGVRVGGCMYDFTLECRDDGGDSSRAADIYRALCFDRRVDILLGPGASDLASVAAGIAEEAGIVMLNHAIANEALYERGARMLVGVTCSAANVLTGFIRLLSDLKFWRKRLAIVSAPTAFALDVAAGLEQSCLEPRPRWHGVRVRLKYRGAVDTDSLREKLFPAFARNRINALASAGTFAHDVALMSAVTIANLNVPILACLAAGMDRFGAALGEHAEGIVGPSLWDENMRATPEIGPTPREFARRMLAAGHGEPDYPAACAYGAALIGCAALTAAGSPGQNRIRAALGAMRTSTMLGGFAIDRVTGRQLAHQPLLVQWHLGRRVIVDPVHHADRGEIEFPSGWRLILSSFRSVRLEERGAEDDDADHK